jgi:formylglycine-generating enzyme
MSKNQTRNIFLILIFWSIIISAQNYQTNHYEQMILINGGSYTPLYNNKSVDKKIKVKPFFIDKYEVTNSQFLEFVKANPRWRKSKVKSLFADKNYLRNWKGDLELGKDVLPESPVTNVSWFAAKAYCDYYGKKLPTIAEWEFIAKAGKSSPDGSKDEAYIRKILECYLKPAVKSISVYSSEKNYWGVYNMEGFIWEWTLDFSSSLVTGESRGDSGLERNLFCGGGSINASDFKNYPAFMRFAFRSSLKANYTINNLGFRCAKDIKPKGI